MVLQQLELPQILPATLFVVVFAAALAQVRLLQLLRRSRFLMLALFLIYALATPGERLPHMPLWLPIRREGCELALQHILGLIGLLASLALLLERMSLARLVAGLYSISLPLVLIGVARDRAALRLMLVLDGLQRRPKLGWRDWLTPPPAEQIAPLRIERSAWRTGDFLLLMLIAAVVFVMTMHA